MEMKHLYFKERPETLWREKDRGFFKGKPVFLLESELHEESTGMVVDEDLNVLKRCYEHSLEELEKDFIFIDDEIYLEMEKARDFLCARCYETKCNGCQMVKLMADAKEARDIDKEKQEPCKTESPFHKQLTLSDWEKIIKQIYWHYGNVTILGVKRVRLKDEPSVELCLDIKDEDGKEREFLLVSTEHGIFPSAVKR